MRELKEINERLKIILMDEEESEEDSEEVEEHWDNKDVPPIS